MIENITPLILNYKAARKRDVSNQCNFRMSETGIEPDWVLSLDYVLTPDR